MKTKLLFLLLFVIVFLLMPIRVYASNNFEEECKIAQDTYYELFDELETISNDKLYDWFLKYQRLANIYDKDRDTVEIFFTEEEIQLMYQVIETETYQATFYQKVNVANVILNRLQASIETGKFGNDMKEIVTSKNQFAYYRTEISQDTKDALDFAFEVRDTTDGSIGFRSDKLAENFNGWEYSGLYDEAHWFYKLPEKDN